MLVALLSVVELVTDSLLVLAIALGVGDIRVCCCLAVVLDGANRLGKVLV